MKSLAKSDIFVFASFPTPAFGNDVEYSGVDMCSGLPGKT